MQADVNLFDTPTNNLGLESRLNEPLYSNYQSAAQFAMVVVSILFILFAFQIYNKMVMGEYKVINMMSRFVFGLILFLAMLSFLNNFAQKQDFNNQSLNKLEMPSLSK